MPEGFATTIEHLKAIGLLRNVLVDFRPQDTTDQKLSFAANLERVGFDAYFGAPAARNISGSISGDLGHGELRMDSKSFPAPGSHLCQTLAVHPGQCAPDVEAG